MTARNDITGDAIRSRTLSEQGRDNWDKIFKPKCTYPKCKCPVDLHQGEMCVEGRGKVPAY